VYDPWQDAIPNGATPKVVLGPTEGVHRAKTSAKPVPLLVRGRIVDANCRPIRDAYVWAFHRDPDGNYGPEPEGGDRFYYYGVARTDSSGRFELTTVRPGAPQGPAHIHMLVAQRGQPRLSFEIQFADDPRSVVDPQVIVATPERLASGGFRIDVAVIYEPETD
jgi:protocatechuate 3,4-dioxygenase beta subunit